MTDIRDNKPSLTAAKEAAQAAQEASVLAVIAAQEAWQIAKRNRENSRGSRWFKLKAIEDEAYASYLLWDKARQVSNEAFHAARFATL
jgi:hypothetical protein